MVSSSTHTWSSRASSHTPFTASMVDLDFCVRYCCMWFWRLQITAFVLVHMQASNLEPTQSSSSSLQFNSAYEKTSVGGSSGHERQYCWSLHETSGWTENAVARKETWTSNPGRYEWRLRAFEQRFPSSRGVSILTFLVTECTQLWHWPMFTNIVPCFFLLHLFHRQSLTSCTIHSRLSAHSHLDRHRPWVRSSHWRVFRNRCSHTVILCSYTASRASTGDG